MANKSGIIRTKINEGVGKVYVEVVHSKTAKREDVVFTATENFEKYIESMNIEINGYGEKQGATIERSLLRDSTFFVFVINEY